MIRIYLQLKPTCNQNKHKSGGSKASMNADSISLAWNIRCLLRINQSKFTAVSFTLAAAFLLIKSL